MVFHATDGDDKDVVIAANASEVGPDLGLNLFGDRPATTCRAENDVLMVLPRWATIITRLRRLFLCEARSLFDRC